MRSNSVAPLDSAAMMRSNSGVRCGNLTADARQTDPESLAGLCGLTSCASTVGLSSQGPAPLRTWGFSLASRFCGVLSDGLATKAGPEARCNELGLGIGEPYLIWHTTKPIPDPQCLGMQDDRGTDGSAGLWLQRLKHRTTQWRRKRCGLEWLPGVSDSSLGVN